MLATNTCIQTFLDNAYQAGLSRKTACYFLFTGGQLFYSQIKMSNHQNAHMHTLEFRVQCLKESVR